MTSERSEVLMQKLLNVKKISFLDLLGFDDNNTTSQKEEMSMEAQS